MVKKQQLGQSLLEAIFAITITGLILAGFVSGIIYFGKTSQVAQSNSEATQLAQERIEELRAERKRSSSDFWDKIQAGDYDEDQIEIGKFNRSTSFEIYQEESGNYRARVSVITTWIEQGEEKTVNINTYFSQY